VPLASNLCDPLPSFSSGCAIIFIRATVGVHRLRELWNELITASRTASASRASEGRRTRPSHHAGSVNGAAIRECINKFGNINSRHNRRRKLGRAARERPRTCAPDFPCVLRSSLRGYARTRAMRRLLPFNQARSVKVAITRAYAALAAPPCERCDARARAHTHACAISCCSGLFRRRERIRAEASYVTHNSTNSITKFQVIPRPFPPRPLGPRNSPSPSRFPSGMHRYQ